MLHHVPARNGIACQHARVCRDLQRRGLLMPHVHRRADGAARIARRRLDVDALERPATQDLAVGDRVHGATARERQIVDAVARVQPVEQMEEGLLVHGLRRSRDVAMTLLERRVAALGTEQLDKRRRVQPAHVRLPPAPLVVDLLLVVAEVGEIERKSAVPRQPHDPAHLVEVTRLAIGREPHHLVLVAVVRKTDELRDRLVEHAERMRERHPAIQAQRRTASDAPGGGGEIAEAVDRNRHRLFERRHVEGRGHVRQVMLDAVEFTAEHLARKRHGELDIG